MRASRIFGVIVSLFVLFGGVPDAAFGQSEPEERAELIRTQNSLTLFRKFEQDSRHLYFLQANAIIAVQGGWNEGDLGYGTHAALLGEAAESLLLPKFKRLSARLDTNAYLNEEEKRRLQESVAQVLVLVDLSQSISDALKDGNLETAILLYHDQATPIFESIWATNYTLISEAERRLPRR
ncbi:hypothetical protein [Ruegeria arenilitoris]|uniref:hypothetical protein n=1 Tax=Ruegeria arenilitoris TaxID=1173585 RepID=UPI001480E70C|nr:hypothetical protein [Ruegeria arenilitoris]